MTKTYQQFIDDIINTRGRFNCDGYKERHHIIPKCMGGTNDVNNLIDLYAEEHYIAHKLLASENPNNPKLTYAWWFISHDRANQRFISEEDYATLSKKYAQIHSNRMKLHNPMKNKTHTPEARKKISELAKGRIVSQETRDKMSKSNTGAKNGFYGKRHNKGTRDKMKANHPRLSLGEHPRAKSVYCIELDREFSCIKEAEQFIKTSGIRQNLKGVTTFAGRHPKTQEPLHWVYAKDKNDKTKVSNTVHKQSKTRKVRCIELDKQFTSVKSASDFIKRSTSRIIYCCQHPNCKCGGYHWEYDTS